MSTVKISYRVYEAWPLPHGSIDDLKWQVVEDFGSTESDKRRARALAKKCVADGAKAAKVVRCTAETIHTERR